MQKNELKIGVYHLLCATEETRKGYSLLPDFDESDLGQAFFQHILKKGDQKSLSFLESLGIDLLKLTLARPVAPPDEEGVVLYLCCAPICATLLAGGDIFPRKSEETEGISVIFVSDKNAFSSGLPVISEKQVEMRFVIPLPFDEAFLKDK